MNGIEWMPDGKYLVFSRGSISRAEVPYVTPELWRIPVDRGAPQKIGVATTNRASLSVHPNGQQIAFTAGEENPEVWVMEDFLPPLQTDAR